MPHADSCCKSWPEATIRAELEVFRERMYHGASAEELRAGLEGLDFLTRRSPMSDGLAQLVEMSQTEGLFRAQIMERAAAEVAQEQADVLKHQLTALIHSNRRFQDVVNSLKDTPPDVVEARVRRAMARR